MEYLLGGFAFAVYIAAQFLAVVAVHGARLDASLQPLSPKLDDQPPDHRTKLIWQSGT
jgi:hypothetical protein